MSYKGLDTNSDESCDDNIPLKHYGKVCPLSGGPSKSRLRAQELMNKVRKPASSDSAESDSDRSSSNTDADSSETVDLLDANKNNTKSDNHVPEGNSSDTVTEDTKLPKWGKLETTEYALVKPKTRHTFKCSACEVVCHSTKEMNIHYADIHPPLNCGQCRQTFNNPSSLRQHSYNHIKTEGTHPCERCGEVFPFEGQLKQHRFKHRTIRDYPCLQGGCKRSFFRKKDLKAHVKQHTGPDIKCRFCDYTAKDICYVHQHERVHSKEPKYRCPMCNKGFRFYQQKKRHVCTNTTGLKKKTSLTSGLLFYRY